MGVILAVGLWLQFNLCGFLEPPTGEPHGPIAYSFGEAPNLGPLVVRREQIRAIVGVRGIGQTCSIVLIRGQPFYVRGSWQVVSCVVAPELPHCSIHAVDRK